MMINPVIRTFREKRTKDLRAPDVIGELFMLLMLVVIAVGAGRVRGWWLRWERRRL